MKNLILFIILGIIASIIILITPSFGQIQSKDCPFGDDPRLRFMDSLKNRWQLPAEKYQEVTFDHFAGLKLSKDFSLCAEPSVIDGYILEVEPGGIESCNCHSKANRDTHIYLVKDSSVTAKSRAIIVEVTPAFRNLLGTTEEIKKKYKGRNVSVYGYVFQDQEHKASSAADNGRGLLWRSTVWEIHPVTKIELR